MGKDVKVVGKEYGEINGLIDRGCEFEGKLVFEGVVQINGGFKGDIVSDGRLIIGKDANIQAKVNVGDLVVEGRIEGNIEAKGRVEIRAGATVIADLVTNSLVVEDGGTLHGACVMDSGKTNNRYSDSPKSAPFFVEREDDQNLK